MSVKKMSDLAHLVGSEAEPRIRLHSDDLTILDARFLADHLAELADEAELRLPAVCELAQLLEGADTGPDTTTTTDLALAVYRAGWRKP